MGLFSNKDKPCPFCGGATPRLLARKFDGQPICGNCNDNILADDEIMERWSLDDLREHLEYRAENRNLVERFQATRTVDYDQEAVIDDKNRLFFIKQWTVDNPPVFRFSEISGFTIECGYQVVESWSRGMARVPFQPIATGGVLGGLAALAEAFDDEKKDSKYENLKVTLKVSTPYLSEYELCDLSVSGNGQAAFANDMAREMGKVNTICNLIVSLAGGASPSGAAPSAPSAEQTADGIKKFKELLDAGIITQDEYDAKKKQLLGI